MIINIPLQIDEKIIEGQLSIDYESKIFDFLKQEIVKSITNRYYAYRNYSVEEKYADTVRRMIDNYFNDYIKEIVEQHKDIIIDKASAILADRLFRSKRGKEILDKYE